MRAAKLIGGCLLSLFLIGLWAGALIEAPVWGKLVVLWLSFDAWWLERRFESLHAAIADLARRLPE